MKKADISRIVALVIIAISLCYLAYFPRSSYTGRVPPVAGENTYSYVACYFRYDNGSSTWYWALDSNNNYFTFNGNWISARTGITRTTPKFTSDAKYVDLVSACNNAQNYYQVKDARLAAFFAADHGALGNNYPIVLGGYELFPLY